MFFHNGAPESTGARDVGSGRWRLTNSAGLQSRSLSWQRELARDGDESACIECEAFTPPRKTVTPWRGSLLPLGCAAVVKNHPAVSQINLAEWFWGLLRSPAGASSLATGDIVFLKCSSNAADSSQADSLTGERGLTKNQVEVSRCKSGTLSGRYRRNGYVPSKV
jgi:hypothetical protein